MKFVLIAAISVAAFSTAAEAQNRGFSYGTGSKGSSYYVAPHSRGGGTVGGHYRTTPDGTRSNNYGSYGNYNRHSGGIGDGYGRSRRGW